MTKKPTTKKSEVTAVRVLPASEYPEVITAPRGAYTPDVCFVAVHPLGYYWVEQSPLAGHTTAMFLPRRARSRMQNIGSASTITGALKRIADHEDQIVNPDAPREEGKNGPVSIFSLGKRTGKPKTPTELDREIEAYSQGLK